MSTEFDDWFAREVLAHERALVHYLQRCWPHRDELHDLRQEVYVRIYEAAARSRPTAPKAFLFATARHLMADRARRGRVVSIEPVGDFDSSNVYLIDEVSPERWTGTRQALRRLVEALDRLPGRCREVVWLRRVEELSQKEVAQRLGISGRTVEKHLAKGMRLIADHLYGGGPLPRPASRRAGQGDTVPERGHGRQQDD
ncbi:RNA polymerase sigma factor [Pseudoxanthomonas suwonensis]|uniref:RNA polymerase sigma factor n=1 Tax=Pseudoxanthomonas suwonensis TaxID=314722 RepID=UPI0004BCB0FE|nr:sigma-70 family RNA polymerase sigma factor [Pseudoxanthomonas suwonensis]